MQVVQNDTNQDLFNQLLEEAKRLGEIELRAFIAALVRLLPTRKPEGEQDLIQALKDHQPSKAFWEEYNGLADKSEQKILTEEERERLLVLVKALRVWDLKKLQTALQLSEMWRMTLDETREILEAALTTPADA
ncbi:MAG: hypothetical protein AAF849_18255 [Bacteroidota bacterium]